MTEIIEIIAIIYIVGYFIAFGRYLSLEEHPNKVVNIYGSLIAAMFWPIIDLISIGIWIGNRK